MTTHRDEDEDKEKDSEFSIAYIIVTGGIILSVVGTLLIALIFSFTNLFSEEEFGPIGGADLSPPPIVTARPTEKELLEATFTSVKDVKGRLDFFHLIEFSKRVEAECAKARIPYKDSEVEEILGELLESSPIFGLQVDLQNRGTYKVGDREYIFWVVEDSMGLGLDAKHLMELGPGPKIHDIFRSDSGLSLSQLVAMHLDEEFTERDLSTVLLDLDKGLDHLFASELKASRSLLLPIFSMDLPVYLEPMQKSIRAAYLTEMNNPAAAVEVFESVPDGIELPEFGRCYFAMAVTAEGDLVRAREILDTVPLEYRSIAYRLAEIEIQAASGKSDEALRVFAFPIGIRTNPRGARYHKYGLVLPGFYKVDELDYLRGYAFRLIESEQNEELRALCRSVENIEKIPELNAWLEADSGNIDRAIGILDSALKTEPYYWGSRIFADLLIRKGDPDLFLNHQTQPGNFGGLEYYLLQSKNPHLPEYLDQIGKKLLDKDSKQFSGKRYILNSLMKKKLYEEVSRLVQETYNLDLTDSEIQTLRSFQIEAEYRLGRSMELIAKKTIPEVIVARKIVSLAMEDENIEVLENLLKNRHPGVFNDLEVCSIQASLLHMKKDYQGLLSYLDENREQLYQIEYDEGGIVYFDSLDARFAALFHLNLTDRIKDEIRRREFVELPFYQIILATIDDDLAKVRLLLSEHYSQSDYASELLYNCLSANPRMSPVLEEFPFIKPNVRDP